MEGKLIQQASAGKRNAEGRGLNAASTTREHRMNWDVSGEKTIEPGQYAYLLWPVRNLREKRRLVRIQRSDSTFAGLSLHPIHRKPFCQLLRVLGSCDCQGLLDDFRNFLGSEECLESARLLEAVARSPSTTYRVT
jgi:hypothetical protein